MLQRAAASRSIFCRQANLWRSNLTLLPRTCPWTRRNFSNCLNVSGSSSWETFFIQRRAPRYSLRFFSISLTVNEVSSMALWQKVSTSYEINGMKLSFNHAVLQNDGNPKPDVGEPAESGEQLAVGMNRSWLYQQHSSSSLHGFCPARRGYGENDQSCTLHWLELK